MSRVYHESSENEIAEPTRGASFRHRQSHAAQLRKYLADDRLVTMLTQDKESRAGTLVFVGGKDVTWHPFAT